MTAYDLIVLGAGPAGAAAALEADRRGLSVRMLDEAPAAGGQVHRAPSAALTALATDPERAPGDRLRDELAASRVGAAYGRRVWLVEPGFTVASLGPDGPETAEAPALIVAAGAQERFLPVPGWTLPGVFGLAAATVLLKSDKVLPGRRVVVAGTGPLLALVAAGILKGGGKVAALVDLNRRADWLAQAPQLLRRPGLAARGAGWLARIAAAGVPILSGHGLRRIEGHDRVERVEIGPVGEDWAPTGEPRILEADAVCAGIGLVPSTEVTRLLAVAHRFDPGLGGWVAVTDADGATTLPGLYVCGDAAGILGAAAAPASGRLAALAAVRRLGRLQDDGQAAVWRGEHERAAGFGRAMTGLSRPRPGLAAAITVETVVCRCEGLTRAVLDRAIAAGSVTLNDLKAATRCGMGPCTGRVCGEAAALLIESATGRDRTAIGQFTGRPPLRPMPLDQLAGQFDYDALPIPAPAPL